MNRKIETGGTMARKGMMSAMLLLLVSAKAWGQTTDFSASGGTVNGGTGFTVTNAVVASPAGVLNVNCPSQSNCTGGTLTIQSNDGLTALNATFTSGSVTLVGGCSRAGCSYLFTLTASLSGTLTVSGQTTSITGDTVIHLPSQRTNVLTTSTVQSSSTFTLPAYSPMYITDAYNMNIAKTDDFTGTNYTTYGSQGSGTGQFSSPWGVSVYGGKIYIADSGNNRLVRMDDMKGTNWSTFGTKGAGIDQFNDPRGLFIDPSSGQIYITDSGNARIVRIDDFTGTRWLSYGVSGTGTGQFNGPVAICLDAQKRIYVADAGNSRVVRFDDMTGTNFTVTGGVLFSSPSGVGVDALGQIYISDQYIQYVYRMDDITGTNLVVFGGPNFTRNPFSLFVDSGGTFYTGDYDAPTAPITRTDANGQGFTTTDFGNSSVSGLFQPQGIFMPPPPPGGGAALKVSAKSLAFGNENINTTSAPQAVTLTNFGSAPLSGSVSASANFAETDNCANLAVGASCTINATFAPTTTGPMTGNLTLTNNAVNNPAPITLTGTGTAPVAGAVPAGLTFFPQLLSTTSGAQTVVLSNSGTGPLSITSIAASGDFSQTNNCGSSVAAGVSCTISVSFTPQATGTRTGTLVVNDNDSSRSQTVNLSGTGTSTAPTVTVSPASLVFPDQLVKTTRAVQTVTVTNNGNSAVAISGFATSGDFSQTHPSSSSIAAGKSYTIKVTFTPTATGTRTGSLTFTLPTGSQTVALTGTGTPKGTTEGLTVSPASLAFGGVALGDGPSQTVTVTNSNGVAVGIGSIGISGSTTFTKTTTCGSTLAAAATCTITVTFTPTALVTYSGSLNVTESAGAVHKVTLSGTGSND